MSDETNDSFYDYVLIALTLILGLVVGILYTQRYMIDHPDEVYCYTTYDVQTDTPFRRCVQIKEIQNGY